MTPTSPKGTSENEWYHSGVPNSQDSGSLGSILVSRFLLKRQDAYLCLRLGCLRAFGREGGRSLTRQDGLDLRFFIFADVFHKKRCRFPRSSRDQYKLIKAR